MGKDDEGGGEVRVEKRDKENDHDSEISVIR